MQEGVYVMQHHRLPFMVTTLRSGTLAASQATSIPSPRSKRSKWRKGRKKYMSLVSTSCVVVVFALLGVKLVTAGLTAILWGIGILNVSCMLGGLASYWQDSDKTVARKSKAPTDIPVTARSYSETLEPVPPMQDSRHLARQKVSPFESATAGITSSKSAVSASAA